jgi:hypothetical protein
VTTSPVIIIGAPRSGTNMLRDLLTALDGYGTWPCDEINYVWRHGNVRHPSDRFTAAMATPEVAAYIRSQFDRFARSNDLSTVVEKTCANSLRVAFIDRILPDARFVYIYRDGIDAAASAMKRWTAKAELGYLARKARWVPPSDLPYYGMRFIKNRVHKLRSEDKRLAFWGPALDDMQQILANHPLDEVCALQWAACVDTSLDELADVPEERVHRIKYEELVTDPDAGLKALAGFLDIDPPALTGHPAFDGISPRSVGKGRKDLGPDAVARLEGLVGSTLQRAGYA